MIKKIILYTGCISLAIAIFFGGSIKAQGTNRIIQSPFYDAISIFYAMKNYKAYPVATQTKDISGLTAGQNPFAPDKAKTEYKIIESATGKILADGMTETQRDSVLDENQFAPDGIEKKVFIYHILARNAHTADTSFSKIDSMYLDNYYFSSGIADTKHLSFFFNSSLKPASLSITENAPSPFGGNLPSSTSLLEGLAAFYVEALNREINDVFFVHLKEALSKYPELQILFPKTLQSFDKIKITNYAASMNALKSSFEEDLKNLLENIPQLPSLPKYSELIDKHEWLTVLFMSCDLVNQIKNSNAPADILYKIGNAPYIVNPKPNNYNSTLRLAALISYCLRDIKINDKNTDKIGWVNAANIKAMAKDTILFRIFMGLMAQNADKIIFHSTTDIYDFRKLLIEKRDEVLKGQYIAYNFSESVIKITKDLQGLQNLESKTDKKSDYANLYIDLANEILGLSDNCLAILPSEKILDSIRREIAAVKNVYLPLAKQASVVLAKIEDKEYNMALFEADTLLTKVFIAFDLKELEDRKAGIKQRIKMLESDVSQRQVVITLENDMKNINEELKQKKTDNDSFEEIKNYFITYGTFISSIASAKSPDEVKEAISAFALPKGSSRIKKEHNFSLGLNGYVGLYHAWNHQSAAAKLPAEENGITAPLGLAASWGHFLGGSLTAYAGIIDIGAIFTYKVNSDSSIKSDISLAQVLSPSIGLVYGLPIIKKYNIPLSIGVNYQWGPTLKKVTDAGNSVLPLLAKHTNIFIAMDIPIVNFRVSRK